MLFLDIEGAFPNAINDKLIANLTKRRVPTTLVNFVSNMLKERKTCLKFDDHESEYIEIDNGIGQGDLLSMVLYQYCYVFTLITLHKQHYYWTASFLYLDPTSPHFFVYYLNAPLSTIQGLVSLYFSIGDPRTVIIVRLHR